MSDRAGTGGEIIDDDSDQNGDTSTCDRPLSLPERYLTSEQAFMEAALVFSRCSKDPVTQVGAVIHDRDGQIMAYGYNGMPYDTEDTNEIWEKTAKHDIVCHAVINALLHRTGATTRGSTMYVTLFPCKSCTTVIIQARIAKLIYYTAKTKEPHTTDMIKSKKRFEASKIEVHLYSEYVAMKAQKIGRNKRKIRDVDLSR